MVKFYSEMLQKPPLCCSDDSLCFIKALLCSQFPLDLCSISYVFCKSSLICQCSTFAENDGGRAGVLSTAYLPLAFHGQNKFYGNMGRVLVVSYFAGVVSTH